MPVDEALTPEHDGPRPVVRGVALLAATAICTTFVAGVSAPLASAGETVHPARALQVKSPYVALAECHSASSVPSAVEEPRQEPSLAPQPVPSPSPKPSKTAAPKALALRINSGGGALADGGVRWIADRYFVGGTPSKTTATVKSTTPKVDADERWGLKGYKVPVPAAGTYRVRFHFTEHTQTGPGMRVMDISVEGRTVAKGVDIFTVAGGQNITKVLEFTVKVTDKQLDISITPSAGAQHREASITGLEILSKA